MLIPLAIAAGAGALLYAPVAGGLARQWSGDPAASHGILLALAAVFVLYRRWPALRAQAAQPRNAGFAVMAIAMLGYLLGTLMGEIFIQRASLPIALAGVVLAVGGPAHLRLLRAPIALVALAIPLPSVIVTHLTLPLQLAASDIATGVLNASHIHVVQQGNLLVLDRLTLEVQEACSGLRSLVSLLSVAAIATAVMPIDRWRAAMLFAAAIPIAVVGNGLRVALTGVLVTWIGEMGARGLIHELTGFVAFVGMCAAMLAVLPLTRVNDSAGAGPHEHTQMVTATPAESEAA